MEHRARKDSRTKEQRALDDKIHRVAHKQNVIAKKSRGKFILRDAPTGCVIASSLLANEALDLLVTTTK